MRKLLILIVLLLICGQVFAYTGRIADKWDTYKWDTGRYGESPFPTGISQKDVALWIENSNESGQAWTSITRGTYIHGGVPVIHNDSGSNIEVTTNSDLDFSANDEFAISCWIYADAGYGQTAPKIVCKGDNDGGGVTEYQVYIDVATGTLRAAVNDSAAWNSTIVLGTGAWHHVVFTYDGTTGTMYKNVTTTASNTFSKTVPYDAANLFIGNRKGADRTLDGMTTKLIIFNKALTSRQVQELYDKDK